MISWEGMAIPPDGVLSTWILSTQRMGSGNVYLWFFRPWRWGWDRSLGGRHCVERALLSLPRLIASAERFHCLWNSSKGCKSHWENDSMPCESRVIAVTKCLRKPERRKGFCAPTVSVVTVNGHLTLLLLGSRTMWSIEAAHPMMERRRLGTGCTLLKGLTFLLPPKSPQLLVFYSVVS